MDEGTAFHEYELPIDKLVEIHNIIIEPSNTATSFLVIGELKDIKRGVVINLDF